MKSKYVLILGILGMFAVRSNAQYSDLHDFNDTDGAVPYSSLAISGNVLYGVTLEGGVNWASNDGNIFSVKTDGSNYKDLFDFNFANGRNPYCQLALSGSRMYGVTWMGESNDFGNIFVMDTNGASYNNVYDFDNSTGGHPRGSLTLYGSTLYGLAESGGAFGYGCIFSTDTNGSAYTDLFDFNNTNGSTPEGALTLSGNTLYGMTSVGGAYNNGCIFSMHTNGSCYKVLFNFNDTNGSNPQGTLTLSGGKLFGMTYYGGANAYYGNIFSIDTNGYGFKDIHDFYDTLGGNPAGSLTLSGNLLYGMTSDGGVNGDGLVFSIDTNGTGYTDLFDFNGANGEGPQGSLTLSGNVLYGMTPYGGANGSGVVFSLNLANLNVNPLVVSIDSVINVTCNAGNNGSASTVVSGGTAPYSYSWSPNIANASKASNLSFGTYTVTVTDMKGHTATASASIAQPNAISGNTVSIAAPLCNGELASNVTIGANGGVSPYTYAWSPNIGNGPSVNNISAGTYTVNITDNNGCLQQMNVTITQPTLLRVGIKTKACQGPTDGTAEVKAVGGTAPYTYSWAPGGGTTAYMTGLSTGSYTVTITDNHNCLDTVTINFDCEATGISQVSNSQQINVYPNPTANQVNVTGVDKGMTIEMYDNLGRTISNVIAENESVQFNLFNQPSGMYMIRILAKDGSLVSQKKVLKAN